MGVESGDAIERRSVSVWGVSVSREFRLCGPVSLGSHKEYGDTVTDGRLWIGARFVCFGVLRGENVIKDVCTGIEPGQPEESQSSYSAP